MQDPTHATTHPNCGSPEVAGADAEDGMLSHPRRIGALWAHLVRAPFPAAVLRDQGRAPTRVRLLPLVFGVVAAAWLVGAALFLRADGSVSWSLERKQQPPATEHNLALLTWGPTLRASSYYQEAFSHHHPVFLIDARAQPHEVEKWTSGYHDPQPWTEIVWREPRRLERSVIYHAGWRESADWTIRQYRLVCLGQEGQHGKSVDVTDNTAAVATHALGCDAAYGLRIEWTPNAANDKVRVYEIEAWGR